MTEIIFTCQSPRVRVFKHIQALQVLYTHKKLSCLIIGFGQCLYTQSLRGDVTIKCHHQRNPGEMRWCRMGSSCVTQRSGSIDGTEVTIDRNVPNVFSVTMRGLKTESSGWYLCVSGNLQFPVVSEVSVKAGGSISIPCLYSSQYTNHVKYLCKGYDWISCTYQVKTNEKNSTKFSISDDKIQKFFTVTVNELTNDDLYYWCAVEINDGADDGYPFHLSVTTGKSLQAHSSTSSPLHSQKIKLSHYCL
uniref:Ig-like domain-containing protein n=1 Tax=Gasterosteus aculeatus aculeatus TaxID=481459 RepID=A0AAQ4RKR8_GASAC